MLNIVSLKHTMSDNEVMVQTCDGQLLAAEFKDGQLQILEVTPFGKSDGDHLLPDLQDECDNTQEKYLEVLDGANKGVVRLDLLNLTLVRCQDGEESYQLLANAETSDESDLQHDDSAACIMQSNESSGQDGDGQSYLLVDGGQEDSSFVMLKPADDAQQPASPKKPLTPAEILEKAKALQKAKSLLSQSSQQPRARKRKSDLPPPHELLASPNFKLYLYSCKMCSYKCNAVKEMSAHKATAHGGGLQRRTGAGVGRGPPGAASLQCAKCPFRGAAHLQLMKHVQEKHTEPNTQSKDLGAVLECDFTDVVTFSHCVQLDTAEVKAADVLVCGACGFESSDRPLFRKHIEEEHNAVTC